VPRRVLVLLADRLQGGGHELQGAANRLYVVWQLTRVPPTLEIAARIAADLRREPRPRGVAIDDILRLVTRHYGISPSLVLSPDRLLAAARPRHVAMYLAYVLTGLSLPEIGHRLGDRHHATVRYGIRRPILPGRDRGPAAPPHRTGRRAPDQPY
jgi:chromosomal replication initiator protein